MSYQLCLTTSMAHVEGLKVPRTRSGEFNPAILPERRRASFDLEELVFAMPVSRWLKEGGVKSVKLFVTDNLSGFTETTARVFPESQHQLCVVHHVRNCLRDTRAGDKAELAHDMKTIYRADNIIVAKENYEAFKTKWEKRNPKAVHRWEASLTHLLTFYNFEPGLRRYIYTTNVLERLNKEIKRRIKVIEVFIQHGAQSGENVVLNIMGGGRKTIKTKNAEPHDLGGQTQLTGHYQFESRFSQ